MEFALDRRQKQAAEMNNHNDHTNNNHIAQNHHSYTNGHTDDENPEEQQYLDLVRYIMKNGKFKDDRTGVGIYSIFGVQSRYNLRNDSFPLLTTKQVYWKAVVEELLWFIKGSTSAKELAAKKVRIWDANGSRVFLDQQGLNEYEEGDLGPIYGFQWRHFGAEYKGMKYDYTGQGVDQLKYVIDTIKNDPNSRRIVMSSWNPMDIPKMALPPCHCMAQFYVSDGELSCQLYQRAGDMGLGVPFNIASYALLLRMVAHVTGLKPGDFVHTQGDTHIYSNHVNGLTEQLTRKPRPFPKLRFKRQVSNIDEFTADDIELIGYNPHPKIALPMAL